MTRHAPNTRSRRSRRVPRDVGRGRLIAVIAVATLFVVGGAALALVAPGKPRAAAIASDPWRAVVATSAPVAPTPAFASLRGVSLRLPVPATAVTVLAFHQSSYRDTVALTPMIAIGNAADARRIATAARATIAAGGEATVAATPASGAEDAKGVWTGSALQVWRSTSGGAQNSAVDCGAAPGTPVLSPIDGTVMEIRPYKLYKKYDDFEIHIKPDAWNDLDLIVLHVTDPVVQVGARVVAGVTQIARVRCLSKLVSGLQLRNYTLDGGNHTHIQVNTIPRPAETWVLGQDPPGLIRHN